MSEINIGNYLICPGRRVAGLVTKHGIGTNNYNQVASILCKHSTPILYIGSSSLDEMKNRMTLLLDFTNSDTSIEDIASELEATGVAEVLGTIKPPVGGFITDTVSERLTVGGQRVILLREPGYRGLLCGIRERFGSGGAAFLYYIGFEAGTGFVKFHKEAAERIGIKDPETILRHIGAPMFQWAGFGRLEPHDLSPDRATFSIHGSFECELAKGQTSQPYSQFVRGMMAGVLSGFLGRRFEAIEKECIALGAPCCRFEAVAIKE